MNIVKSTLGALAITACAFGAATTVHADDWPAGKTITITTGGALGGGMDLSMRTFGAALERKFGATVRYQNKQGASGAIALDTIVNGKKDGSQLLATNLPREAFVSVLDAPVSNWNEIFSWVGTFSVEPGLLLVHKDSPWKTMEEFIEHAKTNEVRIAVPNWITPETLALFMLSDATGAKFTIIPMGGKKAATALIGKHIEANIQKAVRARSMADSVRYLTIFQKKNTLAKETGGAPTASAFAGTKIADVASFRSILVHSEVEKNYPDRYKKLVDFMNEMQNDPQFLKDAQKYKFKDLLVSWGPAESAESFDDIRSGVEKYKARFNQK